MNHSFLHFLFFCCSSVLSVRLFVLLFFWFPGVFTRSVSCGPSGAIDGRVPASLCDAWGASIVGDLREGTKGRGLAYGRPTNPPAHWQYDAFGGRGLAPHGNLDWYFVRFGIYPPFAKPLNLLGIEMPGDLPIPKGVHRPPLCWSVVRNSTTR